MDEHLKDALHIAKDRATEIGDSHTAGVLHALLQDPDSVSVWNRYAASVTVPPLDSSWDCGPMNSGEIRKMVEDAKEKMYAALTGSSSSAK